MSDTAPVSYDLLSFAREREARAGPKNPCTQLIAGYLSRINVSKISIRSKRGNYSLKAITFLAVRTCGCYRRISRNYPIVNRYTDESEEVRKGQIKSISNHRKRNPENRYIHRTGLVFSFQTRGNATKTLVFSLYRVLLSWQPCGRYP